MAISVVMPALEMAQETGKLVSWKKKAGDQVKKGEMLLEVETDKAVVEIEAAGDGVLGGVTAKEGDVVPVGQTIAWLLKPGEQPPTERRGGADRPQDGLGASRCGDRGGRRRARARVGRRREDLAEGASPRARARRRHRDAQRIRSRRRNPRRGHHESRVAALRAGCSRRRCSRLRRPLRRRHAAPSGPPEAVSSIGRIMAERTTQSWTTVPHFFVTREVDASALNATRERLIPVIEKSHGVKVTHTDLHRRRGGPCAAPASAHERQLGQRQDHVERRRQRRAGHGRGERGRHCRDPQRGQDQPRRHREAAEGAGRARARESSAAGRHHRRDVHDQQPRHVQRRCVHGDHRAAAGGHPRCRRDCRSRRRGERHDWCAPDDEADAVVRSSRGRRRAGRAVPERRRAGARRAREVSR